jgi:hypothetical protein
LYEERKREREAQWASWWKLSMYRRRRMIVPALAQGLC